MLKKFKQKSEIIKAKFQKTPEVECESVNYAKEEIGNFKIFIFLHRPFKTPKAKHFEQLFTREEKLKEEKNSIGHLNQYFCELTGIHNAWKNRSKEIIGTAHYRRYLNVIPLKKQCKSGKLNLTKKQAYPLLENPRQAAMARDILERYDIILPRADYQKKSLELSYPHPGWDLFRDLMDKKYGNNSHCLDFDRRAFWGNIFIMKKELFEHYCSEIFPILFRCFQEIGPLNTDKSVRYCPSRYPGYLAERFTTGFINAHRLRYYEGELVRILDPE